MLEKTVCSLLKTKHNKQRRRDLQKGCDYKPEVKVLAYQANWLADSINTVFSISKKSSVFVGKAQKCLSLKPNSFTNFDEYPIRIGY